LFAIVPAPSALEIAARAAVAAAPTVQRETVGLVVVAVLIEALIARLGLLRCRRLLCASDKRRQPIDVVASVVRRLLARALDVDLILRLMILLLRKRLRVARQVRLWLAHAERRIAYNLLLITLFLIECVVTLATGVLVFDAREVWVVLPELLLRRSNEP